ncbi:hypothetical protein [Helicobacter sp. T3_23-1059]
MFCYCFKKFYLSLRADLKIRVAIHTYYKIFSDLERVCEVSQSTDFLENLKMQTEIFRAQYDKSGVCHCEQVARLAWQSIIKKLQKSVIWQFVRVDCHKY